MTTTEFEQFQTYCSKYGTAGEKAVRFVQEFGVDLLPQPQADKTEEGNLLCWWDGPQWHVEIEFHQNGMFEYFWTHRLLGKYWGGSGGATVAVAPEELIEMLRKVAAG